MSRAPEKYDPEASPHIMTTCPGCGDEIVVFQSGSIAEERDREPESGVMPASLVDAAFQNHFCDANDREWVCENCYSRYDDEESAEKCCRVIADKGYSLVAEFEPDGLPNKKAW